MKITEDSDEEPKIPEICFICRKEMLESRAFSDVPFLLGPGDVCNGHSILREEE